MTEKRKEQFKASQKKLRLKQKKEGKKTISFSVSKELFGSLKERKEDKSYSVLLEELIEQDKSYSVLLEELEELRDNYVIAGDDFFDKLAFFRKRHPDLIHYREHELWLAFRSYSQGWF